MFLLYPVVLRSLCFFFKERADIEQEVAQARSGACAEN